MRGVGGAVRTIQVTVLGPVRPDDLDALRDSGVRRATEQTVLTASVRDQAALRSLLQRLGALGLELVELHTADPGRADVEIVVAGRVGVLLEHMLRELGAPSGDRVAGYRVHDVDLADVVDRLEAIGDAPGEGEVTSPAAQHRGSRTPSAGPGSRRRRTGEDPMDDVAVDDLGPIDYLVVELPTERMDGSAFPLLVDLVDRGIIRVIDLAFFTKDEDGVVAGLELRDLDLDGEVDMTVFEGASTSLLGDDDLEEAAAALMPGRAAAVLVYENTWAAPFAAALRRAGAQLVAGGRIPVQAMLAALDAADAA